MGCNCDRFEYDGYMGKINFTKSGFLIYKILFR